LKRCSSKSNRQTQLKVKRKIRTRDVQTAEEVSMAVTYYVALPFIRTEDGAAPGEAQECQSEAAAIRRAEGMSRDPANAGAVAFKRAGDPNVGEFSDAVVLKKFRRRAGRFERAVTRSCCSIMTDGRVVIARSHQLNRLRRCRHVLPQCSDSVAMGAIADVDDARSKKRF
jgi:hypothetical protein